MRAARNSSPLNAMGPKSRDQRRAGRLKCQLVTCDLGEVIDISGTGMKIAARGRPLVKVNENFAMRVDAGFGPFSIQARAVWIKRTGLFRHTLGLEFTDVTPDVREKLTFIARRTVVNETDHPGSFGQRVA